MKDFIILTKIGTGAYSEVYKVKRLSDAAVYALKKVRTLKISLYCRAPRLLRLLACFDFVI